MDKIFSWTGSVFVMTALSGCTSNIAIDSNLDPSNIEAYFSFQQVNVIESLEQISSPYKILGVIEGEACQQKAHHQLPSTSEARTDARRKAANIGANAIYFSSCTLIEHNEANKHCVATQVCYGQAMFIKPVQSR
ncbi:Rcs stress response system protein RcsF [Thalassotalea ganghwensis]